MATQVVEVPGASLTLNVDGTEEGTRVFRLFYDGTNQNPYAVATDTLLPAAWSNHPNSQRAKCQEMSVQQDSDPARGNVWVATAKYSSKIPAGISLSDLFAGQSQDPEFKLPRISWATNQQQVYRDIDLAGFRKCNSAGDPLLNAQAQFESTKILTTKYFVRQKPAGLLDLVNKINNAPFTVDGEFVPERCARVIDIQVGDPRLEKGVLGRDISAQIEIGPQRTLPKAKYIGLTSGGSVETNKQVGYWVSVALDRGKRQYDATVKSGAPGLKIITSDDGMEITEPALLDGAGVALATPVAVGSEVYRYWYDYVAADFTAIRMTY